MKNTYDIIVKGERVNAVEASSPKEAVYSLTINGLKVKYVSDGDESNYNCMTRLIKVDGKLVKRISICYYNVETVERDLRDLLSITVLPIKTLDHNTAVDGYIVTDYKEQKKVLIHCGSYQGHDYVEYNLLMYNNQNYSLAWYRDYFTEEIKGNNAAKSLYTELKKRKFNQLKSYKRPHKVYIETRIPTPIYIKKRFGKEKDCFKFTGKGSIPAFLRNSVAVDGNDIVLRCLEGLERISKDTIAQSDCPYMAIAWEKVDVAANPEAKNTLGSVDGVYYNVWWKKNAHETLIEKDGKFFEKAMPLVAVKCSIFRPDCLGNTACIDRITSERANNGLSNSLEWRYNVSWSKEPMYAKINRGFWVKYGEGDLNYLELGTESAKAYCVCDEKGNELCSLEEYAKGSK